MKNECLTISYFFPPIKSIAVLRNYNIANNFLTYFSKVHVITTSNRHRLLADPLPIDAFNIIESNTFDYRTLASFRRNGANMHFSEQAKAHPIMQLLVKLHKSFPFNLIWGEGGLVYIIHAFFLAAKLLRQRQIQLIFTSYMPYSDHFVAFLLKKFFPKVLWVADFRDLHVEPVYKNVVWESFQHACNRRILRRADVVTTVSEGLAQHLRQYHSRVEVLRNGITPSFFDTATSTPNNERTEKFTISYTGSMFGDERNPSLFLQILQDLVKENIISSYNFQIVYAGKDVHTWKDWTTQFGIEKLLVDKGLLSLANAQILQRTSHINLLLTTATKEWSGVLTGKFYEYLAAERPILVLINGVQDVEFELIINTLNAGLVGYNAHSYTDVRRFIIEKFEEWQATNNVVSTIHKERIKAFGWDKMMESFIKILDIKGTY
jgi:hypothetical protein